MGDTSVFAKSPQYIPKQVKARDRSVQHLQPSKYTHHTAMARASECALVFVVVVGLLFTSSHQADIDCKLPGCSNELKNAHGLFLLVIHLYRCIHVRLFSLLSSSLLFHSSMPHLLHIFGFLLTDANTSDPSFKVVHG